jgi:putative oxidoreductase
MNKFFSTKPIMHDAGITAVRVITGIFLIYHGFEILDADKIKEYGTWDAFKNNANPMLMPYIGKGAELLSGVLLALGLFTRVGCVIAAGTMLYIAFFVGHGKIWYEDQYSFLFAVLAFVLFCTGPCCWSLDKLLFDKKGMM